MSKPGIPFSRDFNPQRVEADGAGTSAVGDRRDGGIYVYPDRVTLAVRVALVTGRPLLVRGPPGWGKSSLAAAIARHKNWRYLERVISSRTQARDLMSELDLVQRLSDAQTDQGVDPDWRRYIRPGVLWEAFEPGDAEAQQRYFARDDRDGAAAAGAAPAPAATTAPAATAPAAPPLVAPAVVLIDEMDKAEPDVPNNLLIALGSLQFTVEEIRDDKGRSKTVRALPEMVPLIIVTTNDERDLPRAFLRRCVEIELPVLDGLDKDGQQRKQLLVEIGEQHLKGKLARPAVQRIADVVVRPGPAPGDELVMPSPAEFIDTLRAVHELYGKDVKDADIEAIAGISVRKRGLGAAL